MVRCFLFLALVLLLALQASPCRAEDDSNAVPGLRLVACNIKHGRGMDGKLDLERIARVLRAMNPDLFLDKGGAKTFPSDQPRVEIDFFATRGFTFKQPS